MGTENEEALESLLVNIRSVVLSCKGGVLLNQLQDDFRKLIGTYIPFEEFGYSSIDALLRDAPGFVSLKRNSNGQVYAEAVADSSTAHLSNLISKQKGSKVVKGSKPKFAKKSKIQTNNVASVSSNSSTASRSADEKDREIKELKNKLEREKNMNVELTFEVNRLQAELKVANKPLQSVRNITGYQKYQQGDVKEIEDLKMRLEKEMRINKGYSSELERTSSMMKMLEDALRIEKSVSQELKERLKSLPVPSDEEKNNKDNEINILVKEIEDLKSKLEKEKKLTRDCSSQIIRLNSLVKTSQDSLSAEQDTIKKLKSQIESLQLEAAKETTPVYEYLNSASKSEEKNKSLRNLAGTEFLDGHINLLETDARKQLSSCNNQTSTSEQNSMLAVLKSYENQMSEQMQKFVNQIKKQNQKLMFLEKTQQKHYQKLDDKIKSCNESSNIENIIQKLLEHPQFMKSEVLESKNFYASDNNLYQLRPSITPISSLSDNDSEQSFKATSLSSIGHRTVGLPQVAAFRLVGNSYSR